MIDKYLYSKSTKGFYIKGIHKYVPPDVVDISIEQYKALMEAQENGLIIVPDSNGKPIPVTKKQYYEVITPLTSEELASRELNWRNKELIRADIELNKVQDNDSKAVGTVAEWRAYRKELRSYPDSENFPNGSRPTPPK